MFIHVHQDAESLIGLKIFFSFLVISVWKEGQQQQTPNYRRRRCRSRWVPVANLSSHWPFCWPSRTLLRRNTPWSGKQIEKTFFFYSLHCYSAVWAKTGKSDAPINDELNILWGWNFVCRVNLVCFCVRESFKQICIFYNFEAPPFENGWFSGFENCAIGFKI